MPKTDFFDIDFSNDKALSPEERREWNDIYASYRAKSLLTGRVVGVDELHLQARNPNSGLLEDRTIRCLVVLDYRVKVLIPETEVWFDQNTQVSDNVLRNMPGAMVDYVIREVDREGECALASRRLALDRRQRTFRNKLHIREGDKVTCQALAIGPTKMLVTCHGFDRALAQHSISHGMILDLREDYHSGDVYEAIFQGFQEDGSIRLSIRDAKPHPFDGADNRPPVHSRRVARITGKYAGGVHCALEKELDCLCLYSPEQRDSEFDPGDWVIIVVSRMDYARKKVYGIIVGKR